jgi:hypothetical protein
MQDVIAQKLFSFDGIDKYERVREYNILLSNESIIIVILHLRVFIFSKSSYYLKYDYKIDECPK